MDAENNKSIKENFYGSTIIDEYRYYENLEDSVVLDYLTEQDILAENYFNSISNLDVLRNEIIDYNSLILIKNYRL